MASPTNHGSLSERARAGCGSISRSPRPAMPSRPRPSADQGIKPPSQAPPDEPDALPADPDALDIFSLAPLAALRLLTLTVERLVRANEQAAQAALAAAADAAAAAEALPTPPRSLNASPKPPASADSGAASPTSDPSSSPGAHHHEDIPRSHKTPIGSPETPAAIDATSASPPPQDQQQVPPPALGLATAHPAPAATDAEERQQQRRLLARKFYSKAAPPIPLAAYLRRLHTYCPMSTAVYLTAGLYIERLAAAPALHAYDADAATDNDDDFHLPVTSRTAHRLLLGALRIATKALEDLSFSHTRFAKVGGVSDKELTRLEVSFLFLVEFRLVVAPDAMAAAARRMWAAALEEGADAA